MSVSRQGGGCRGFSFNFRHAPRVQPFHTPGMRVHISASRCLRLECDLDPLILRARLLRSVGQLARPDALTKQELLPRCFEFPAHD